MSGHQQYKTIRNNAQTTRNNAITVGNGAFKTGKGGVEGLKWPFQAENLTEKIPRIYRELGREFTGN